MSGKVVSYPQALFNLYRDIILNRNIDQRPGIKIGGHTINNLRYADDTVLLAENETELQQILDTVKTQSERYGLFMNVKTKSMVFSRNKDIPKLKLLINGNEIEQVKSFPYLGALVTEDGRCECELNRRIAVAKNNFSKMSRILTDHDMSVAT